MPPGNGVESPPDWIRRLAIRTTLKDEAPLLALAPMQDVTDLPFWKLQAGYGPADFYYTEYFRVYPFAPHRHILHSIIQNPTGRSVVAQMIGNDIPALVRTARRIAGVPIVAVDLNLDARASLYRKCAAAASCASLNWWTKSWGVARRGEDQFTVKTRLGFDTPMV